MKDIFKLIPFTTLILIYLYISGALYFFGFWETFKVDFSAFVSIVDIPKNFIFPFLLSHALFLLGILPQLFIDPKLVEMNFGEIIGGKRAFFYRKLMDTIFATSIFIIAILALTAFKYNVGYWFAGSFFIVGIVATKFSISTFATKLIPPSIIRWYVGCLIFSVPIFSLAVGKINAIKIYNNETIHPIRIIKPRTNQNIADSISLKLLGFLGDKLIVSSINNNKIFILNQADCEVIEIGKRKWIPDTTKKSN